MKILLVEDDIGIAEPLAKGLEREGFEVIRAGDRVFFEPGEEHWHGAAPDRFMTHVAMHQLDETGSAVSWGEHVGDEEYTSVGTH